MENGHIDVLVLTQHDWANTVYRYTKCLEMLGLRVVAYKGEKHPFGYPDQLPIHPALKGRSLNTYHFVPQLQPYAEKAKVIHFFTSTFIDSGVDPFSKTIVIQHGGTVYRIAHQYINGLYNHFVDTTIIQTPDLMGLGANHEVLITSPVQIDKIKPRYKQQENGKIVIGHFPRDPRTKGTPLILEVVEKLQANEQFAKKFKFVFSTDQVPWRENLKRMAKCDVIIECCNPEQHGRKFGEWGNTALEAASLGKIVISNSLGVKSYNMEYGNIGLFIANNRLELEKTLVEISKWSKKFMQQAKRNTRKWVETNHSMEATAKRLWNKVYKPYFEGGKNG